MKAVIKKDYGPDQVEYTDFPKPEAEGYDVILKVKAAAICGSDLVLRYGTVEGKTVPYPIVIGHEFTGVVCEVGPLQKRWKIGDRVVSDNTGYVCGVCPACASGNYLLCSHRKGMGNDMDGGMAEYVKIPGETLQTFPNCIFRVPYNVSDEEASIIEPCCNGYKAVIQEGELHAGQDVVVYGCGPMGLFAMNAAKLGNAGHVIAVGKEKDLAARIPLAMKIGATDYILSDKEDVVARVREITGEEGVPLIIDAAGAPIVLEQAIQMVSGGGKIVKVGYTRKPLGFNLDNLAMKGASVIGHMGYNTESWLNVLNLLKEGKIDLKPYISHVLPMSRWDEGFELVRTKKATKVVLVPDSEMESKA